MQPLILCPDCYCVCQALHCLSILYHPTSCCVPGIPSAKAHLEQAASLADICFAVKTPPLTTRLGNCSSPPRLKALCAVPFGPTIRGIEANCVGSEQQKAIQFGMDRPALIGQSKSNSLSHRVPLQHRPISGLPNSCITGNSSSGSISEQWGPLRCQPGVWAAVIETHGPHTHTAIRWENI